MTKTKAKKPLFSIVTVCYNSENSIERTILSVLNQSFDNYEFIIVDGDSRDSTKSIVNSYKSSFNNKIKMISEKDDGIYDAMNKGIYMSKGDFVLMLNSGDTLDVDALKNFNNNINKRLKYQVIHGLERVCDDNGDELFIRLSTINAIRNQTIRHQSAMISKNIYNDLFVYNCKYLYASDYDFFVKLSLNKNVVFTPMYKIVDNFYLDGLSSQGSSRFNCEIEYRKIQFIYGFIKKHEYIWYIIKLKIKKIIF